MSKETIRSPRFPNSPTNLQLGNCNWKPWPGSWFETWNLEIATWNPDLDLGLKLEIWKLQLETLHWILTWIVKLRIATWNADLDLKLNLETLLGFLLPPEHSPHHPPPNLGLLLAAPTWIWKYILKRGAVTKIFSWILLWILELCTESGNVDLDLDVKLATGSLDFCIPLGWSKQACNNVAQYNSISTDRIN